MNKSFSDALANAHVLKGNNVTVCESKTFNGGGASNSSGFTVKVKEMGWNPLLILFDTIEFILDSGANASDVIDDFSRIDIYCGDQTLCHVSNLLFDKPLSNDNKLVFNLDVVNKMFNCDAYPIGLHNCYDLNLVFRFKESSAIASICHKTKLNVKELTVDENQKQQILNTDVVPFQFLTSYSNCHYVKDTHHNNNLLLNCHCNGILIKFRDTTFDKIQKLCIRFSDSDDHVITLNGHELSKLPGSDVKFIPFHEKATPFNYDITKTVNASTLETIRLEVDASEPIGFYEWCCPVNNVGFVCNNIYKGCLCSY